MIRVILLIGFAIYLFFSILFMVLSCIENGAMNWHRFFKTTRGPFFGAGNHAVFCVFSAVLLVIVVHLLLEVIR